MHKLCSLYQIINTLLYYMMYCVFYNIFNDVLTCRFRVYYVKRKENMAVFTFWRCSDVPVYFYRNSRSGVGCVFIFAFRYLVSV